MQMREVKAAVTSLSHTPMLVAGVLASHAVILLERILRRKSLLLDIIPV